jgi:hypothetical protein
LARVTATTIIGRRRRLGGGYDGGHHQSLKEVGGSMAGNNEAPLWQLAGRAREDKLLEVEEAAGG